MYICVDHWIIVSMFDHLGVDIETEISSKISSNRNMNVEVELVGQLMKCLENQDFWCTTWWTTSPTQNSLEGDVSISLGRICYTNPQ